MVSADSSYEGFYARFETPSKKVGSLLMGPDNLVGDDFSVKFKTEGGRSVAWLENKFGAEMGFLDVDGSRKVQLACGRGMEVRALLSFVAYSDTPEPGLYWGEVAVICFNPAYADEMNAFSDRVASKLADGIRPAIDLRGQAASRIVNEKGWMPSETVPLPKKESGMAVLKDHRSASEKMIEQGRAGNKGCYAISIAFLVVIVLGVAYFVAHLLGAV